MVRHRHPVLQELLVQLNQLLRWVIVHKAHIEEDDISSGDGRNRDIIVRRLPVFRRTIRPRPHSHIESVLLHRQMDTNHSGEAKVLIPSNTAEEHRASLIQFVNTLVYFEDLTGIGIPAEL